MKKFNLKNEIIVVSRPQLLQVIHANKPFAICIEGKIHTQPFSGDAIYIYQGTITAQENSAISISKPLSLKTLFGATYTLVEDSDRILIKAGNAWNDIIKYNTLNADYDDTSGDGISDFSDKNLENIGWHATEFDISYRELSDHLESVCEGTLLCVEIEEPYQFSGLGFISDRECANEKLFTFCKDKIADALANNPDFLPEDLNDDEEEAAQFFKLL